MIYCGIDWAEKHHDVALVDDTGQLVAKRRITDDATGYQMLLDLLAEYGDSEEDPIPVAIETSRGLLVAVLRTGTRKSSRSTRWQPPATATGTASRARSPTPATPSCWRTSCAPTCHAHRPLPGDSDLARAIAVLARAQQDATWNRQQSPTSSDPSCGSTTPQPWTPSPPGPTACADQRPGNCSSPRLRR